MSKFKVVEKCSLIAVKEEKVKLGKQFRFGG